MLHELSVRTSQQRDFIDVTERVEQLIRSSKIEDGVCVVYSPHTTAAVTVNANADPDVVSDLLGAYADVIGDERRFKHAEGNSGAHALISLVGPSVTLPIHNGRLSPEVRPTSPFRPVSQVQVLGAAS